MESFLEYNRNFVADKQYEHYTTSKYPDRNVAIVACTYIAVYNRRTDGN